MIIICGSKIQIKLIYLFLIELLLFLLNLFSLGLFYPFFVYLKYLLIYNKTQINNLKLRFKANIFIFYIKYLAMYFLSIATLGFYRLFMEFKLYKWAISNTYIEGENSQNSYFNKDILEMILVNVLTTFILLMTFGLGFPIVKCIRYRFRLRNTYISGKNLKFIGNSKELIHLYLKWIILTILTLGIYGLFINVLEEKYRIENTVFANNYLINVKEEERETKTLDYVFMNVNHTFVKLFIFCWYFIFILIGAFLYSNFILILPIIDIFVFISLLYIYNVLLIFLFKLYENKRVIFTFVLSFFILILILLIICFYLYINNILVRVALLILNVSLAILLSSLVFYLFFFNKKMYE